MRQASILCMISVSLFISTLILFYIREKKCLTYLILLACDCIKLIGKLNKKKKIF